MEKFNVNAMKNCKQFSKNSKIKLNKRKIHWFIYSSSFFFSFSSLSSCRHGARGCCVHCSPLEPFDEIYLKEQNIKHLSFHSYLRKLTAGVDRYAVKHMRVE